jgi:NADH dehydrogenase [ubiquinone] 1 alpha subcomplex assembly factor 1
VKYADSFLAELLGYIQLHLTNRIFRRNCGMKKLSYVRLISILVLSLHGELVLPSKASDTVQSERRVVFDFHQGADVVGWEIEDDGVMGGMSRGAFTVNGEGHAVFSGEVSLENNGGFSSLQWYFPPMDVSAYTSALLRVKGDGKTYQFRVESTPGLRHNYVYEFSTSGAWETIEIPLSKMYAEHHGNRLDLPNYPGKILSHVRFLIANGQAETFELLIDRIELK